MTNYWQQLGKTRKWTPNKDIRLKTRYDLVDFRLELAHQLIGGYRDRKRGHAAQEALDIPHIFCKLERPKSICKLCTKHVDRKRKETVYGFKNCNKHLCSEQCFRTFHLGINFVSHERKHVSTCSSMLYISYCEHNMYILSDSGVISVYINRH